MVIWRGWGILSVVIAAATFFAFAYLGDLLIGEAPNSHGAKYGMAFGLAIGAALNWFAGRSFNHSQREAGVSVFKRHSLFFIPMEYWSIAFLVASIVFFQEARH